MRRIEGREEEREQRRQDEGAWRRGDEGRGEVRKGRREE